MRCRLVMLVTSIVLAFALPACQSGQPAPDEEPEAESTVEGPESQHEQSDEMAEEDGRDEHDVQEAMAEEHADDSPVSNEGSEQEPAAPVDGQMVQYAEFGNTEIEGFLAHPAETDEDLPAVLLVHEWWGLNHNIRSMARRLAGEGYLVLAVDLFDGEQANTPEQARALVAKVRQNRRRALANISSARQHLEREYEPTSMGIMGWCFGGSWALRGALNMRDHVDAVVMYYGDPVTDASQLADLQAPLLGIFGGADQSIPVDKVEEFEETLEQLDKEHDIEVYEGAGHAFANPSGETYDAEAAEEAWEESLEFLEEHLE